jgi:hypothetical protein
VKRRDPEWYREEAARSPPEGGNSVADDPGLRDRYLALALEYNRLAEILERQHPSGY